MSVKTFTSQNFDAEALQSSTPVLVDFWATWCGPCRMLSPVVDEIANETSTVTVGKVNIDEEPQLAAPFGVMSIPTLVLLRDGKAIASSVGVQPKQKILAMLEDAVCRS